MSDNNWNNCLIWLKHFMEPGMRRNFHQVQKLNGRTICLWWSWEMWETRAMSYCPPFCRVSVSILPSNRSTGLRGMIYLFQQDSVPSHMPNMTQDWLSKNLHIIHNMWSPSCTVLNLLDYYVWDIVKKETNHNAKDSFKATIMNVMANTNRNYMLISKTILKSHVRKLFEKYGFFFS